MGYDSAKTLTEQLGPTQVEPLAKGELPNLNFPRSQYSTTTWQHMIKYINKYREILKKQPRSETGNSENDLRTFNLADQLYKSMKGLNTNHEDTMEIFRNLGSVSDFIELEDRFNERYGKKMKLQLWLRREWVGSKNRGELAEILKGLINKAIENPVSADGAVDEPVDTPIDSETPIDKPIDEPIDKPADTNTSASGTYHTCPPGDNYYGCKSTVISQVQHLLKLKPDGMFGPKTQSKLKQVAPQYSDRFTDEEAIKIRSMLTGTPDGVVGDRHTSKIPPLAKLAPTNIAQKTPTNMTHGFVEPSRKEQRQDNRANRKNDRLANKANRKREKGLDALAKGNVKKAARKISKSNNAASQVYANKTTP